MKRTLKLLMMAGLVFILTSCSFIIDVSTTESSTTQVTTTQAPTTDEVTLDYDALISDVRAEVYERIYNELYNDIKAEILADISQEEIESMYQNIRDDLIEQIELGNIEIESATIFEQLTYVGLTAAKAVVGVNSLNASGEVLATGSGVIYKQDGNQYYVVSNYHVIEDATNIQVQFSDGSTIYTELLGVEDLVDIAVLKFTSTDVYQTASFGDSDALQKGEFITAVGNPSGFDYFNTMTFGIISGLNRYFDIDGDNTRDMFVNYIQHDAAINAGNSGGALFNMYGEIVGINTLKIVDYSIEGMGFAIPSSLVSRIVSDIEVYGYSNQTPVLGIQFLDIETTSETVFVNQGIEIPEEITQGFYVISVLEGSTLDGYVQPGDIIVQIGDIVIENSNQYAVERSIYLIGDIIDFIVYRNGEIITLKDIQLKGSV